MYDAIVVGGRCAGAAAALLLARQGWKVAVLERDVFPRDTVSGHYLHLDGVARLARWGLRDELATLGAPPVETMRLDLDGCVLEGAPLPVDGETQAFCPRRDVFDTWLLAKARAAGAEVMEGARVDKLLVEDGRVCGVAVRADEGLTPMRARLVIGADGMQSTVARGAGAAMRISRPTYSCAYYGYWNALPVTGAELYVRGAQRRFVVAAPTNHGQTVIAAAWPADEHEKLRGDLDAAYLDALQLMPGLARRVERAHRGVRLQGKVHNPNFIRESAGPGWVLIGDAGYHKDPVTAQGMSDALRDADDLAQRLAGAHSDDAVDRACRDYETARNAHVIPMFEHTCGLAQLQPAPPEVAALTHAMQGQTDAIARFLGVMAGSVPVDAFFAPANLAAIMGARAA